MLFNGVRSRHLIIAGSRFLQCELRNLDVSPARRTQDLATKKEKLEKEKHTCIEDSTRIIEFTNQFPDLLI